MTNNVDAFFSTTSTDDIKSNSESGISKEDIPYLLEKEKLFSLRQDREERKKFANKIFVFLCINMALAFMLLFFNGFGLTHLNESVLITTITSSIADIIGVFVIVVRYLFPCKQ